MQKRAANRRTGTREREIVERLSQIDNSIRALGQQSADAVVAERRERAKGRLGLILAYVGIAVSFVDPSPTVKLILLSVLAIYTVAEFVDYIDLAMGSDPGTPSRVWPAALFLAMQAAFYFALRPPPLAYIAVAVVSSIALVEFYRWLERGDRKLAAWRNDYGIRVADEAVRQVQADAKRRGDEPFDRVRDRILRRTSKNEVDS